MNVIEYFKQRFEELQSHNGSNGLGSLRETAFNAFTQMGIPTTRHEEWKYTRITSLFNKEYQFPMSQIRTPVSPADIDLIRLPGHEHANELVFINGFFSFSMSMIRSAELIVLPLEEATKHGYKDIITNNLGHSSKYLKDGINALNTAFVHGGVFIHVEKGQSVEDPVYIYNITDARLENIFSQPRSLVHISENAQIQLVETYATMGVSESFTNQVMEVIVEKDAIVEYYKVQNDAGHAN